MHQDRLDVVRGRQSPVEPPGGTRSAAACCLGQAGSPRSCQGGSIEQADQSQGGCGSKTDHTRGVFSHRVCFGSTYKVQSNLHVLAGIFL